MKNQINFFLQSDAISIPVDIRSFKKKSKLSCFQQSHKTTTGINLVFQFSHAIAEKESLLT